MADGLQREMGQFESTERTHRKRAAGNIFAIDKRAWAAACSLGMNAAVAYLVLARGTGGDQRTVGWSVNAIENKTGIGRPNARKAIERLIAAGFVRKDRGGTKLRYYLTPAHELLGAVSRRRTNLTPDELRVLAAIRDGHRRPPRTKGGEIWGPGNCYAVAMELERAGLVRRVGNHEFEPVEALPDEEKPDWIWLPNAIIDGAGDETPPAELIRQSQNAAALRLFIDLYHAHELNTFGGVSWRPGERGIRQTYARRLVEEYGKCVVWMFEANDTSADGDAPFVAAHFTGSIQEQVFGNRSYTCDTGWRVFWDA